MTEERVFDLVIPRGFDAKTGGFIYDRRIVEALRDRGWRIDVHELDGGFPTPTPSALAEAEKVLARIPCGRQVVIDGLALGAMPAEVAREAGRLRLIALIHHPLALETGVSESSAYTLREAEKAALAAVGAVIVTSRTTARALAEYDVETQRIRVVYPGTDPASLAVGSGTDVPSFLCVASLTSRKGHTVLIEALDGLRNLPWSITCVGSHERDRDTAAAVRRQTAEAGLGDRVRFLGELDDRSLHGEYARADAFVLASHYEGYGMVLAEALARGLPIVACAGGAVAETVPEDAGLLVPPGDIEALRDALARLIGDLDLRTRLQAGARRARRTLPTWQEAAEQFAFALRAAVAS